MRRLALILFPLLLLSACGGPGTVSPPLQVADEHPHFANCATYIQSSMPGEGADGRRAVALERCLENNTGGRQVATRL
ncbi:hypothetical protein [Niveispirillum sp.]|uniref:hypothetical protein n=1 Tax=Niveispirillum sp. TaxID=1917217 RepID=UPI001B629ACF|nr:hypothetical protein [Niveispirillum sp.]MBP7336155.1 hypothetical protein [Niveispirillum sp.]